MITLTFHSMVIIRKMRVLYFLKYWSIPLCQNFKVTKVGIQNDQPSYFAINLGLGHWLMSASHSNFCTISPTLALHIQYHHRGTLFRPTRCSRLQTTVRTLQKDPRPPGDPGPSGSASTGTSHRRGSSIDGRGHGGLSLTFSICGGVIVMSSANERADDHA